MLKGVGNSNGSDFTLTVFTEGKRDVCHCVFGNDTNCKVFKSILVVNERFLFKSI